MEQDNENIALFDMDGTLCDFEGSMFEELEKLRSTNEEPIRNWKGSKLEYVRNRTDIITRSEEWWANLPKFQLGWDVLEIAEELGYRRMILTQGPRRNPAALAGKKKWLDKHLGEDFDFTITRDKGLVYGRVLVDDYPPYIEGWVKWRKNGLVIMPANPGNENYEHPQVIRYDGSNLPQVKEAMEKTKHE